MKVRKTSFFVKIKLKDAIWDNNNRAHVENNMSGNLGATNVAVRVMQGIKTTCKYFVR